MTSRRLSLILAFAGFMQAAGPGCATNESETLPAFDAMYLDRRPPVGAINPVDLSGENLERKILAASLQGVVNREKVRLYLVGGGKDENRPWETDEEGASARFWIDLYRDTYGVKWGEEIDLDGALSRFGAEVRRIYLIAESEPWSIHVANSKAAIEPGLIVFDSILDSVAPFLTRTVTVDLRGIYATEADAVAEVDSLLSSRPHPRLAVLSPQEYRLRDFLIQQGVLTAYARPGMPMWDAMSALFGKLPLMNPIYGYIALTGIEEFLALRTISSSGQFLVPTDTVSNLSVHSAIVPQAPAHVPDLPAIDEAICSAGTDRFTLAISDADNMAIPINRYVRPDYWPSEKRGVLPVGWSIGLSLKALGPAAMDYYLRTSAPNDEWISMIGIGYALPAYHATPEDFLRLSFSTAEILGLRTSWFLDVPLLSPDEPAWTTIAGVASEFGLDGLLIGYIEFPDVKSFQYDENHWALVAASQYEDTPQVFADRVRKVLAGQSSRNDPVTFLSASVWSNTYDGLAESLVPLQDEGAVFLTPSQALRCARATTR